LLIILAFPAALRAQTWTWDGESYPFSNWSLAFNWNPDSVPSNNGTANIIFGPPFVGYGSNVDAPCASGCSPTPAR
jgi:hypothetical protein